MINYNVPVINNPCQENVLMTYRYLVYGSDHVKMVYATSEQHARSIAEDVVGDVFLVQRLDLPC